MIEIETTEGHVHNDGDLNILQKDLHMVVYLSKGHTMSHK